MSTCNNLIKQLLGQQMSLIFGRQHEKVANFEASFTAITFKGFQRYKINSYRLKVFEQAQVQRKTEFWIISSNLRQKIN